MLYETEGIGYIYIYNIYIYIYIYILSTELRSCVKVEVAVLGSRP